jgi:hypothetical protein
MQQVIRNYTGVRVSSTGRRFRIVDATVWTLQDPTSGAKVGQAVRFAKVTYLNDDDSDGDSFVVGKGGVWVPVTD